MQKSSTPDSITPATPDKPHNTLLTWRNFGRGLIALAVLATLIGLFYVEEDWRGRRAWEKYKREAEAQGVNLDWHKLVPPSVPDDQNFAMTPFLAPLLQLNNRPFNGSKFQDSNAVDRAQTFAKPIIDAHDSAKPNGIHASELEPPPLEAIAAEMLKKEKSPTVETNFSREAAATFILERMKPYEPVLDELHTASQRPYARFNVHYEDEDPAGMLVPHLFTLRRLSILLQIKASSELALGRTDAAFEDARLMIHLAESLRDEPIIISQLVRIVILDNAKIVVWEGLAERRWSDAQLQSFETDLGKVSLLKSAQLALEGERTFFGVKMYELFHSKPEYLTEVMDELPTKGYPFAILFHLIPNGWLYQEQVAHQRIFDDKLTRIIAADGSQIHPQMVESTTAEFGKHRSSIPPLLHHELMVQLWMPALLKFYPKPAHGQTGIHQAIIACALERYRLAHGQYPENLEALAPKFMEKVPLDVCNGQPMKYRRTDDGQFVLYSVGWNEKDDGGKIAMTANKVPHEDISQGDWVWPKYN